MSWFGQVQAAASVWDLGLKAHWQWWKAPKVLASIHMALGKWKNNKSLATFDDDHHSNANETTYILSPHYYFLQYILHVAFEYVQQW